MITGSIVLFSLSGMEKPKEREILNFTKELARQHEADFYNILEAKKQEEDINAEMNKIAKQQKKESKSLFKKSSKYPKFC